MVCHNSEPQNAELFDVDVVVLLFYVHGKHLRSCRDGQTLSCSVFTQDS